MNIMLLFAMTFGWLAPANVSPAPANVDVKASSITWKGYKVTGEHTGKVSLKSADLTMSGDVITGGTFVIDMASITCTDLQGDMAGKLVGHLKSDDFFGVEKFPTATLKITKSIPTDSKGGYRMVGDLTIKGTSKPVKFNAIVKNEGGKKVAVADIKVDRSEYDVRYGSGSFFDSLGDKTIYDEFDLSVRIALK